MLLVHTGELGRVARRWRGELATGRRGVDREEDLFRICGLQQGVFRNLGLDYQLRLICCAMTAQDLLDQFLAELPGQRA